NQCVAVPTPDGISHPAWSGVGLQLAAVHEDHAIGEVVVQDRDDGWGLQDPPPGRTPSVGLRPARQTLIGRTRLKVFVLTLTDKIVDPRLRVRWVERDFRNWPVPDSREVALAIGRTRRRRTEIGLAVGFARSARRWTIQPLGSGRNGQDHQNERSEKKFHTDDLDSSLGRACPRIQAKIMAKIALEFVS